MVVVVSLYWIFLTIFCVPAIRGWLVRKSFAHHIVKENMIGRTLGDNIDAHEKMLIRTEEKGNGENGVEKDAKEEVCHWLYKCVWKPMATP